MKSYEEILAMTITDLLLEIEKSERELVGIRMAIGADQEKDVSKRKKMKKYVARLKTARRQKELGFSQQS